MPFQANLSFPLEAKLKKFMEAHDFARLYKSYEWGIDDWQSGFPSILELEVVFKQSAKNNEIKREHIMKMAKWGRLRNVKRVSCPEVIKLTLYKNGEINDELRDFPLKPLKVLESRITGLGPTYLSKVLRFAKM